MRFYTTIVVNIIVALHLPHSDGGGLIALQCRTKFNLILTKNVMDYFELRQKVVDLGRARQCNASMNEHLR